MRCVRTRVCGTRARQDRSNDPATTSRWRSFRACRERSSSHAGALGLLQEDSNEGLGRLPEEHPRLAAGTALISRPSLVIGSRASSTSKAGTLRRHVVVLRPGPIKETGSGLKESPHSSPPQ